MKTSPPLALLAFTVLVLSPQSDAKLNKYDGLSGTPSNKKPSRNALCGTNNAWAMSEPTVQSIYQNIAKASGMEAESKHLNSEACDLVRNHLGQFLDHKNVICSLTIKPNGRIVSVIISKTSGSEAIDQKALNLLHCAGPFKSNEFPESLNYDVELPLFKVRPNLL